MEERKQNNHISEEVLRGHWQEPALRLNVFEEVTSTNTLLKQRGEAGEPEGLVYVADRQSQGKGRRGRSFYSPGGTGIYTSILLRPELSFEKSLWITTCAATVVCNVLERYLGEPLEIKWVNDIYYRGRKICGILAEGALSPEGVLQYVVLGIGINVYALPVEAPKELEGVAGGLFETSGQRDLRERILADLWHAFWQAYQDIARCDFFSEYEKRLLWKNQDITILDGMGRGIPAKLLRLNEDFSLQVRYATGKEEALTTGEISIRLREDELL